jgi:hypothetical protein
MAPGFDGVYVDTRRELRGVAPLDRELSMRP